MVFRNNFVAVIKVDGKVLRENKNGSVSIPFGSEYSILLKNMDSRRAVISISIDDDDVLGNHRIVLDADDESTLEGFMNYSGDVTNKFKFIEKTGEISDYRGDKAGDGIVRIEYQFEKIQVPSWIYTNQPIVYGGSFGGDTITNYNRTIGESNPRVASNCFASSLQSSNINCCTATLSCDRPHVDVAETDMSQVGITTKGGRSDQSFDNTTVGALDGEKSVICINLIGGDIKTGRKVTKPGWTKLRITCEMCGRKHKISNDFCNKCGTALKKFI